jgi:hypothetical protein
MGRTRFRDGTNETVTVLRESFDITGVLSRIIQSFAKPPNGLVETDIEVARGLAGPQPFPQFLPRDHLAWPFQQHCKEIGGLLLQFNLGASISQFPGLRIQLEKVKPEYPRRWQEVFHGARRCRFRV